MIMTKGVNEVFMSTVTDSDAESSTVSESSNASSTVRKIGNRGKQNPFLKENGKV